MAAVFWGFGDHCYIPIPIRASVLFHYQLDGMTWELTDNPVPRLRPGVHADGFRVHEAGLLAVVAATRVQ